MRNVNKGQIKRARQKMRMRTMSEPRGARYDAYLVTYGAIMQFLKEQIASNQIDLELIKSATDLESYVKDNLYALTPQSWIYDICEHTIDAHADFKKIYAAFVKWVNK